MIDSTLLVSPEALWLYQIKQFFWLYLFPILLGFVSVVSMQIYVRIGHAREIKAWTAFLFPAAASMMTLYGWRMVTRTGSMIFFYGCGVGLAVMTMSRIYAIVGQKRWKLTLPRVIWKSNKKAAEALAERMRQAQQVRSQGAV